MAQLDRAALKAFFETGDKPTQAQFSDFIDSVLNLIDDTGLITLNKKISVPTVQVKQLNTSPIILVAAPGVGKAIELIASIISITFNTTAYTGLRTTPVIITDTADDTQAESAEFLKSTVDRIGKMTINALAAGTTSTQLIENKAFLLTEQTGNPLTGDSDITLYILYRIINL